MRDIMKKLKSNKRFMSMSAMAAVVIAVSVVTTVCLGCSGSVERFLGVKELLQSEHITKSEKCNTEQQGKKNVEGEDTLRQDMQAGENPLPDATQEKEAPEQKTPAQDNNQIKEETDTQNSTPAEVQIELRQDNGTETKAERPSEQETKSCNNSNVFMQTNDNCEGSVTDNVKRDQANAGVDTNLCANEEQKENTDINSNQTGCEKIDISHEPSNVNNNSNNDTCKKNYSNNTYEIICNDNTYSNNTCNDNTCQDNTCNDNACVNNTCNDNTYINNIGNDNNRNNNTCSNNTCQDNTCGKNTLNANTNDELLQALRNKIAQNGSCGNVQVIVGNSDYIKLRDLLNGNGNYNYANLSQILNGNDNYQRIQEVLQEDDNSQTTENEKNKTGNENTDAIQNSDFVDEVIRLVNIERNNAGLASLSKNTRLCTVANVRAGEIITLFDHTRPNGKDCFSVLSEYNIMYRTAGENIAMGQTSPKQVVEGWMNSPGHRANILNAGFTQIGVGVVNSGGRYYWAQMFIG